MCCALRQDHVFHGDERHSVIGDERHSVIGESLTFPHELWKMKKRVVADDQFCYTRTAYVFLFLIPYKNIDKCLKNTIVRRQMAGLSNGALGQPLRQCFFVYIYYIIFIVKYTSRNAYVIIIMKKSNIFEKIIELRILCHWRVDDASKIKVDNFTCFSTYSKHGGFLLTTIFIQFLTLF